MAYLLFINMDILYYLAIGSSLLVITAPTTVTSVLWLVVVFILTALILGLLGLGFAALTYVLVYVGAIAVLFLFVVQLLDERSTNVTDIYSNHKETNILLSTTKSWSGNIPLAIVLGTLFVLELMSILPNLNSISDINLVEIHSWKLFEIISTFFSGNVDVLNNNQWLSEETLYDNNSVILVKNSSSLLLSPESHIYKTGQIHNLSEWMYGGGSMPLFIASVILLLAMVAPIVLCIPTDSSARSPLKEAKEA